MDEKQYAEKLMRLAEEAVSNVNGVTISEKVCIAHIHAQKEMTGQFLTAFTDSIRLVVGAVAQQQQANKMNGIDIRLDNLEQKVRSSAERAEETTKLLKIILERLEK